MSDGAAPVLLVVDGTALAFRAFFAVRGLTDSQGRPTGALYGFLGSLLRLLEEHPAERVAVAWDRPEPTFRHRLSPDYKATRERMDEDLARQLPWMREAVDLLGLPQLEAPGFEADDILASLAAQGAAAGYRVLLCASDKDLAQVVGERVVMVLPPKRNEPPVLLGPDGVREKFGVPPERMAEWQALVGDSSDNIRGVPGVGPKKATALLERYGGLEEVLNRGPVEEKGRLRENLERHAADARAALALVTLRTDLDLGPLDALVRRRPDPDGLRAFCAEFSFDSLLERLLTGAAGAGGDRPQDAADRRDYRLVRSGDELAELRRRLAASGGFALDTETTSVDPMRARLVGLSFAWEPERAYYVPLNLAPPLTGPAGEDPLTFLAPVLTDPALPKVGQNIKYDAQVLARHGVVVRGWEFDTMLAHFLADPLAPHNLDALALRYLGLRKISTESVLGRGKEQTTMDLVPVADVARYACEDADATWRLVEPLRAALAGTPEERLFREVEMPLIEVLRKMEARGIRVDRERLAELGRRLRERERRLEQQVHELAGEEFNLNSPRQLGPILFERLRIQEQAGVTRVRRTKTGYATSVAALEPYRGVPIVEALLEYRHLSKLRGTYLEALPGYIHPETGRIHTCFHQAVAATGRLSSSDPNLQNIPVRSEYGREIRRAFVPGEEGWILVSADYSQIELRVVAHLADDPALAQAFRDGADVHARTAALVFGVAPEEVTPELRARAKAINFGILYGMGPQRLARELKIPFAEARAFIDAYFEALPGVRAWLDRTLEEARASGEVRTLLGRRRPVPELRSEDARVRAGAENAAVNTPVQGSAADLIKVAMLRVDAALNRAGLRAAMLLQVHDELVFECPQEELSRLEQIVRTEMEGVWELKVPLKVEVGHGPDWASAH
ncbi:MAG: DNA polymerase I [Planctomycetota bacterium]|nr:MAG: DNA polymerase I [Planctomycetota bacterium]